MRLFKTLFVAAMLSGVSVPAMAAEQPAKLEGPALAQIADVSVGLKGLVCDFCSIALNKTFKKNKSVAGTYVDLDTKTLSIVLRDGAKISDKEITKMVKKAGYNVTDITRKSAGK